MDKLLCPICLRNDKLVSKIYECEHRCCRECIKDWKKTKPITTCPMCRASEKKILEPFPTLLTNTELNLNNHNNKNNYDYGINNNNSNFGYSNYYTYQDNYASYYNYNYNYNNCANRNNMFNEHTHN